MRKNAGLIYAHQCQNLTVNSRRLPSKRYSATIDKSRIFASWFSKSESVRLLVWGTENWRLYENLYDFQIIEKATSEDKMVMFEDKSSVFCLEIFVADIKPNRNLEAGNSKLFHEISQVKAQSKKGSHKFSLLQASCAIKLQSSLQCS